jgi:hypothetical protein
MTRKTFLISLLVTLSFFAVVNIAVGRWSSRLPMRIKLDAVARNSDANVLILGNSLLDGHIDPPAFQKAAGELSEQLLPVDAALGASQTPEQYLLFHEGIKQRQVRAIVIGFYDFQLTQPVPTNVSDLIGNRALAFDPRIEAGDAESIYHFDFGSRVRYRLFRSLPMLAYRGNAWKSVELLRRKLGNVGMPEVATNELGRVSDFDALETKPSQFQIEAQQFADNPVRLNEPIERILQEGKERHCAVVFVLMPISPYHQATYYSLDSWKRYRGAIQVLAAQRRAGFIDASQWYSDPSDFADKLHLQRGTRSAFSVRLARAIVPEIQSSNGENATASSEAAQRQ